MKINFRVGFSDFESLELNESQINDLFNYFSSDIHLNQAIIAVAKSGKKINEENINKAVWHGLIQK